jgi:AcrR family transcriptional regulator
MKKTARALQSEQTRERIIAAAMRLFVRKGFYATSIADLSAAVEMTKGALYHHFENKDAIFFSVIETIRKTWREMVGREVLKPRNALDRLGALLDSHARLIEENEAFCLVLSGLLTEMEGVNPAFLKKLQQIYADLISFIEQIVGKGKETGQLRSDLDPKLTALAIVGTLRGTGCSGPILRRLGVDYREMMQSAKRILLRGLKP